METSLETIAEFVCRGCMCKSTNMTSLFEKTCNNEYTLSELLNFITNIDVKKDDELPKYVCEDCRLFLYKTETFRKVCLETNAKLTTLTNKRNQIANNMMDIEVKVEIINIVNDNGYECENCSETFPNLPFYNMHKGNCCNDNKSSVINEFIMLPSPSRNRAPLESNNDSLSNNFEEIKQEMYEDYMENDGVNIESKPESSSINEQLLCNNKTILSSVDEFKNNMLNGDQIKQNIKNQTNNTTKVMACQKCVLIFFTAKSYTLHQKQYHNMAQYQCSMCQRKFKKKTLLVNHIKSHEDKHKAIFTCTTCKREFQHQGHLDNHILSVHTLEKAFKCRICLKNFVSKESLEIHIDGHKIDKKHICKLCNKAFSMICSLKDHLRSHTGEKPYLCSECGKSFNHKNNFKQHVNRHKGLKEFKCETCEKRFVSKGELVAHNRTHTGAHPFKCDDCGSGFTTSSSLRKHRRIHTGERPYACDLCPMRFSVSGTLKIHRRTHTNERPHECMYCEKAFVQRNDMMVHMRCHTGDRPYVCPNCGQAFRKSSYLKSHLKTHLKEQKELSTLQVEN